MIRRVGEQLESQGLGLELTPAAKVLLADKGYDPPLGARPLRRAIQQIVEDPLSERILWKEFRVGETIIVDVDEPTRRTTRSSSAPSKACSRRRWSWPGAARPPTEPSVHLSERSTARRRRTARVRMGRRCLSHRVP